MHAPDIRKIIAEHGRLAVDVDTLTEESCLYDAGLTSLSTVNLMLALEERFDIEFPDRMLGRETFGSIGALSRAVSELAGSPAEVRGAA